MSGQKSAFRLYFSRAGGTFYLAQLCGITCPVMRYNLPSYAVRPKTCNPLSLLALKAVFGGADFPLKSRFAILQVFNRVAILHIVVTALPAHKI